MLQTLLVDGYSEVTNMNLTGIVTVINIIDEDNEVIQCTKVQKVHIEKTNQLVLSGVQVADSDNFIVYYGERKSKSSRMRVPANIFTANPTADTFAFRKGDYIAEGDVNIVSFEQLNEGKQKLGNIYEIVSVSEYLFGSLANIQVTCR